MPKPLAAYRYPLPWLLAALLVTDAAQAAEKINRLTLSSSPGSELQLEVRQTPLPAVLDKLAQTTHVPIHYTVLPDGLVTATCVGSTVKPILECLLAKQLDLVFRTAENATAANPIAEVWIMGSNLANLAASDKTCIATRQQPLEARDQDAETDPANATEAWLAQSASKDPGDRAAAIGGLLASEAPDDPRVKATLAKALSDRNPAVRAQAVSALASFDSDNAAEILRDALRDDSVDVRLSAVAGIGDNAALLQQAVNDRDETVSALAAEKLDALYHLDE